MKRELICITCPEGCDIEVEVDGKTIKSMDGNACIRGEKYARAEVLHPERIVTTTVAVKSGNIPLLPVKTQAAIPKDLTAKAVKEAAAITVDAPVRIGDPVIRNILNTGVDLVATRNVDKN